MAGNKHTANKLIVKGDKWFIKRKLWYWMWNVFFLSHRNAKVNVESSRINWLFFFLFIELRFIEPFFFAFKSRFLIWFDFFFFVFFSISNLSVRRSPTRLWLETWMKPVFPFVNHLLNRKKKKRKKTRRRNKKKKERKSPKEYRFLRLPG